MAATTNSEVLVALTGDEIGLLREALDSYEYWEHRDTLPHDSGFITIMDDDDFEAQRKSYTGEDGEEMREAWEAVKAARALEKKLAQQAPAEAEATA